MPPQSSSPAPALVAEAPTHTADSFRNHVRDGGGPVVLRGLVSDWPVVQAALRSDKDLTAYLKRFDRGAAVGAMFGSPGIGGRFFYNDDLSGFNFRHGTVKLSSALDLLLEYAGETSPSSLAVQSVPTRENLPGFEGENRMPLLGDMVEPRIWVGNAVTVAAHHDPAENVACVVAGRRRFTLFPPDQISNLYMGPFEPTPAGTTISMVDFDAPDLDRYPRFAEATKHALVADLAPGDALYIPYMWWHQVRSTERLNMLVNYWWAPPDQGQGRATDAMMHALMTIRDMPPRHRRAWRALFDHYVFEIAGPAGEHLPPARRGPLDVLNAPAIRALRTALVRAMGRA